MNKAKIILLHLLGVLSIATVPIVLYNVANETAVIAPSLHDHLWFYCYVLLGSIALWIFGFDACKFGGDESNGPTLNSSQGRHLAAALQSAFSYDQLGAVLRFRLAQDLDGIVGSQVEPNWPERLVATAGQEGWLAELIDAVQHAKPKDPALASIRASAGLGVSIDEKSALERIVNKRGAFQDPDDFIVKLSEVGSKVCRISLAVPDGTQFGTGFLVGPDLVLTNYHVVAPIFDGKASAASVICLFDFKKTQDGKVLQGITCRLASVGILERGKYALSDVGRGLDPPLPDELDFALLRLERRIGEQPIGAKVGEEVESGAPLRGWIKLPDTLPALATGDTILILQHPSGEPKKLTFGNVTEIRDLRIRYSANTLGGSSGSPCLTTNFELFGLHHAGDPDYAKDHAPEFNQAIPIQLIANKIQTLMQADRINTSDGI